jgi:hypothetical protein
VQTFSAACLALVKNAQAAQSTCRLRNAKFRHGWRPTSFL